MPKEAFLACFCPFCVYLFCAKWCIPSLKSGLSGPLLQQLTPNMQSSIGLRVGGLACPSLPKPTHSIIPATCDGHAMPDGHCYGRPQTNCCFGVIGAYGHVGYVWHTRVAGGQEGVVCATSRVEAEDWPQTATSIWFYFGGE